MKTLLPPPISATHANTPLWYLSFRDPTRPEGQAFLGACILHGIHEESALASARALRLFPGAHVQAIRFADRFAYGDPAIERALYLHPGWVGHVISRAELSALDAYLIAQVEGGPR